jgi:hypothetical protein
MFERVKSRFSPLFWTALAALWISPAGAATIYLQDFQGAVGSEWSTTASSGIHIASAPNPDYGGRRLFLGEYGNDTVMLSLGSLPAHTTATVSFSLYLIRSWDGNNATIVNGDPLGPDHWRFGIGHTTLFDATFSNGNPAGQSYGGAYSLPGTQPSCSAYASWSGPSGSYAPLTGANECYSLGYTFSYPYGYVYADGHTCADPNGCAEAMDAVYNLRFNFPHSTPDMLLSFSAYGLQALADESWGLDNVQVEVTPVPVPAAAWLFGSGLLGLIGFARRRAAR